MLSCRVLFACAVFVVVGVVDDVVVVVFVVVVGVVDVVVIVACYLFYEVLQLDEASPVSKSWGPPKRCGLVNN